MNPDAPGDDREPADVQDDAADELGPLDDDLDEGEADADGDGGEGDGAADLPDGQGGGEGEDGGQGRLPPVAGKTAREPSRADRRVQSALAAAKAAKEEAALARAEAAAVRQEAQGRNRQQAEEERQARLAVMGPEERQDYLARETRDYVDSQMRAIQLSNGNTADRQGFLLECQSNPAFARVKDAVEAEHARLVGLGIHMRREELAYREIGRSVAKRAPANKTRQAARGAERIAAQTTKPGNPRGSATTTRTKADNDLDARLRGKTL